MELTTDLRHACRHPLLPTPEVEGAGFPVAIPVTPPGRLFSRPQKAQVPLQLLGYFDGSLYCLAPPPQMIGYFLSAAGCGEPLCLPRRQGGLSA